MKRKLSVIFLLFVLICTPVIGQELTIHAEIADDHQMPIPFASINLSSVKEGVSSSNLLADSIGGFAFHVNRGGKYLLKVYAMGYHVFIREIAADSLMAIPVLKISLEPNQEILKEVEVFGKKSIIEQRNDKLIFNVSNTVLGSGYDAMEVLERAPGIYINPQNNTISINGKGGVTVMIDDKVERLSANDLSVLLKNLQSNNIEKIEIIANPGAKYDAQGVGGIINIVTKKVKQVGISGNIVGTGAYGIGWRESLGGTLNYRNGKVTLSGSYNFAGRESGSDNEGFIAYRNADDEVISSHDYNTITRFNTKSNNYRASLGWDISDKSVLNFSFSAFDYNKDQQANGQTSILNFGNTNDSLLINPTASDYESNQYTANIGFKSNLDSLHTVSADIGYFSYQSRDNNLIRNDFYLLGSPDLAHSLSIRNRLPIDIDILSGKIDYEGKILGGSVEMGLKFSKVSTDNNARYENLEGDTWAPDLGRSNHFKYDEQIYAAYATYGLTVDKFDIKLGLRAERTISDGFLVTSNVRNKRAYLNLFPSLFLQRSFNENNSLSVSYSRRINRPSYQDLNPFVLVSDVYSYYQGNPFLLPEMAHNFDLTYLWNNKYTISLGYTSTSDVISYVTQREAVDSKITRTRSENLARLKEGYLNFSIPLTLTKWWDLYNSLSFSYAEYEAFTSVSGVKGGAAVYGLSNYFNLPKDWTPQFSAYFQSGRPEGTEKYKPQYQLNIGLQKSFMNKRLIIRANYSDIFRTARSLSSSAISQLYTNNRFRWDSRFFQIGLTYSFGNTKFRFSPLKDSTVDEQHRIKE